MQNLNPLIHPAYTDSVFKYLMFQDEIRNAFLSVVLKRDILESQIADPSLSPFDDYHEARALLEELMQKTNVQRLDSLSHSAAEVDRSLLQKILQCLTLVHDIFPDIAGPLDDETREIQSTKKNIGKVKRDNMVK